MKKKKRTDYVLNQARILESLRELIERTGRKPTMNEIARKSGVCVRTVKRHMHNYRNENYMKELRILTDDVMIALYQKAKEGRAPEVKLWMQLVENWKETQGINHSGKIKFEKINFVLAESSDKLKERSQVLQIENAEHAELRNIAE